MKVILTKMDIRDMMIKNNYLRFLQGPQRQKRHPKISPVNQENKHILILSLKIEVRDIMHIKRITTKNVL